MIEYLSGLKDEFERAFQQLDVPQPDLRNVSFLYSKLKTKVVEYEKRLEQQERKGYLSELEVSVLKPAIQEVVSHCSAPKNSKSKIELSSALYDGADYLGYYLSQLDA
jgi:hypothetical protein